MKMLHVNIEFARGVKHFRCFIKKKKSTSMQIQFPNSKLVKCNVGHKLHSYAVEVSVLNNHYSRITASISNFPMFQNQRDTQTILINYNLVCLTIFNWYYQFEFTTYPQRNNISIYDYLLIIENTIAYWYGCLASLSLKISFYDYYSF